jgi:hypothetical protein
MAFRVAAPGWHQTNALHQHGALSLVRLRILRKNARGINDLYAPILGM